jgi:REP-associated tyrosine transposase
MRRMRSFYNLRNARWLLRLTAFQGRYKAVMVEKDSYLLELSRYVVLNPVRAHMVNDVADWPWSSYRAMMNQTAQLKCLEVNWLLSQFGSNKQHARVHYQDFVRAGIGLPPVWDKLNNQIFLGNHDFVATLQGQIKDEPNKLKEIPKAQRRPLGQPLKFYVEAFPDAKEGMRKAYETGDYTMQKIADAFGVHYSTVSRAINKTLL